MIRNIAVAGGRQAKNEDFTQYIQSFDLLEQIFSGLNHGDFIVHGCVISGTNVSSGVLFLDGELTLFAGATGATFPLALRKETVGIQPREFADDVVRDTAQITRAVADPLGSFSFDANTPRITDRFLRTVNNALRANIDANNNGKSNIYKPILADRFEDKREIPAPAGADRYLKIGTFQIAATQTHGLDFFGGGSTRGTFAKIQIYRVNVSGTNNANGEVQFISESELENFRAKFYLKRNDIDGVYELWIRSAQDATGSYNTSVISLFGEGFTDTINRFVFEDIFTWSATVPSDIVSLTLRTLANTDTTDALDQRLTDVEEVAERLGNDLPWQQLDKWGINASDIVSDIKVSAKNGWVCISGVFRITNAALDTPDEIYFQAPTNYEPEARIDIICGNSDRQDDAVTGLYIEEGRTLIHLTRGITANVDYNFSVSYPYGTIV